MTFTDCYDEGYRFDLWKLSLPPGSNVAIQLDMDSFLDEPFIQVFNPAGDFGGGAGPVPGNSRRATIAGTNLQGGTWTIYASENDPFITSADYTLTVACSSGPPPPPPPPPSGPCVEDSTTACLLNGRFRARVLFRLSFDNGQPTTPANVVPVTGFAGASFETAFFYVNGATNIAVIVKILDQGNKNAAGEPTFAVITGAASPLRFEVVITDTVKGVTRSFPTDFNSQRGVTDFTAFVK